MGSVVSQNLKTKPAARSLLRIGFGGKTEQGP